MDKCYFIYPEVIHLGFAVSTYGIRPDPRKVQDILSWPRPTTGKQVQSYLGLVNFFRRCIPGYAYISAPLDALRQEGTITPTMWTDERAQAFRTLQRMLVSPPIMNSPHPDLPYELATDASDAAVGAALYQIDPQHGKRYIAFASRKLQGCQRNYSATKRKLLALIYGINKFPDTHRSSCTHICIDSIKTYSDAPTMDGHIMQLRFYDHSFTWNCQHLTRPIVSIVPAFPT